MSSQLREKLIFSSNRIKFGVNVEDVDVQVQFVEAADAPPFMTFFPLARDDQLRSKIQFTSECLVANENRNAVGVLMRGQSVVVNIALETGIRTKKTGSSIKVYVQGLSSTNLDDAKLEAIGKWRMPFDQLDQFERVEVVIEKETTNVVKKATKKSKKHSKKSGKSKGNSTNSQGPKQRTHAKKQSGTTTQSTPSSPQPAESNWAWRFVKFITDFFVARNNPARSLVEIVVAVVISIIIIFLIIVAITSSKKRGENVSK